MRCAAELARRLDGSGVVAQAFYPGSVRTGFGRKDARYLAGVFRTIGPALRSPERGARTLVHLAATDAGLRGSGSYWVDEQITAPSPRALDDALAAGLWERSAALTGAPALAVRGPGRLVTD